MSRHYAMLPTKTPPEPGRKLALLFTIAMHSLLALALFLGVQWKTEHAAVEVELWSPTPRPATRPPASPPPPRSEPAPRPEPAPVKAPDIALQKDKKEEKKKPQPKPTAPDFRDLLRQEDQDRKTRERASQEARLRAEAEAEQRAAGLQAAENAWGEQIKNKVRGNIVRPPNIEGNPEAFLIVTLLPTGEVLTVRVVRSSGNPALDAAIERAFLKSSPLPKPADPAAFKRTLEITFFPYD